MTEETLETIILGHIAKELKDEIQIGRQAKLAKTIMQTLRIHDVSWSVPVKNCDNELYEDYVKSGKLAKQLKGNER